MAPETGSKQSKKPHGKVAYKVSGSTTSMRSTDDEAENRAKARKGAVFLGVVVIGYIL